MTAYWCNVRERDPPFIAAIAVEKEGRVEYEAPAIQKLADSERLDEREPLFRNPEWSVMCIGVLPVKPNIVTCVQIQSVKYWNIIVEGW